MTKSQEGRAAAAALTIRRLIPTLAQARGCTLAVTDRPAPYAGEDVFVYRTHFDTNAADGCTCTDIVTMEELLLQPPREIAERVAARAIEGVHNTMQAAIVTKERRNRAR